MFITNRLSNVFLLITCFISLAVSTSCINTKKVNSWIDKEYEGSFPSKLKTSDYITLKNEAPVIVSPNKTAITNKGKRKILPALVYWHWEYSAISTLNNNIPFNNLNASIITYANAKNLRQKLNGQRLELSIQKIPVTFSLADKGGLVFLLLYYFGWENFYVIPEKDDLVVSYKLFKDTTETKQGTISIASKDKEVAQKIFQGTKKMLWQYLDKYNDNVKLMGKDVVDKLIEELPAN